MTQWSYIVDSIWDVLAECFDYLDSNTLQLAYKAFIRPMMEYGNAAIKGDSATQLSRLNTVRIATTTLCHESFIPLQSCHHAAIVGLLLKLLIIAAVNFYRLATYYIVFHLKFDIT